jgi:hypothetical protein
VQTLDVASSFGSCDCSSNPRNRVDSMSEGIAFVAPLPQAARSAVIVTIGSMLLVVLVLSAARWGHRSSQGPPTSPHPHSVDLKWKASVSRVVGYNVYRSETDGESYIKLTSAPVRTTNYTDRSVQSGHTYIYAVTAVDSKGKESAYSNQAKAPIPSP